MQPDVTSVVVLGVAALATAWAVMPRAGRGVVAAIAGATFAAVSVGAFVMPPFRSEPASPDGGLALLLSRGWPWLAAALGGLLLTLLVSGWLAARRRVSPGGEVDGFERGLGAGLVAATATQPMAALVAQDGVHLLSFGGSGVVASLVAVGLLLANARAPVAARRAF